MKKARAIDKGRLLEWIDNHIKRWPLECHGSLLELRAAIESGALDEEEK